MLDIKKIRENLGETAKSLETRGFDFDKERFTQLEESRRAAILAAETIKAKQNALSKQIPQLKQKGEDTSEIMWEMKQLADESKDKMLNANAIDEEITQMLLYIPNLPHESVPIGADDTANIEIRKHGTPAEFDFEPLPHWELGANLNIIDPQTAAKTTGARFHFYRGKGAILERAIVNFFLDTHGDNGYTEILPPFMVNSAAMQGTGQLPKFAEDAFKVEKTDYYLVPTAEVPVTNMYREQILPSETALPIKHCAYSACFRAEAGSAGRDTRGLIRQHQFNKVELVKFAKPEDSYAELESLTADAERVLQLLKLPYRVVALSSGDLGFSSAKTYDIEVWMPSYNRYVEISSCSNFEDFQARRANIKFRREPNGKPEFLHTLNGSGVAIGRTTAAILENFQRADGTIIIPDALRKYTGFDFIEN